MNKSFSGGASGYRAVIAGTGSALPTKQLSNDDLARMVETSDDWITTRTGIKIRRIADDTETTAHFATTAASKALESSGIAPNEIELVIVGTITPEMVFPSTACFV